MPDFPDPSNTTISGVFNYCFRWCERCPFTDRCATFQLEDEMRRELAMAEPEAEREYPRVMREIPGTLEEAIRHLRAFLEHMGENWEEIRYEVDEPEVDEPSLNIEQLRTLSMDLTTRYFQSQADKPQYRSEAHYQALTVLGWYTTMLAPKVNRALSELTDEEYSLADYERIHYQSDGHGSAKIALLALARSLAALAVLSREVPEERADWRDYALDMLVMQQSLRAYFPQVNAFERPGFDDPEFEAEIDRFYEGHPPMDPFRDGPWTLVAGRSTDH